MVDRDLIRQALAKVEGGRVVDAAEWLRISYATRASHKNQAS
jgi:hypothetical protein